jgi:hypothetical protein
MSAPRTSALLTGTAARSLRSASALRTGTAARGLQSASMGATPGKLTRCRHPSGPAAPRTTTCHRRSAARARGPATASLTARRGGAAAARARPCGRRADPAAASLRSAHPASGAPRPSTAPRPSPRRRPAQRRQPRRAAPCVVRCAAEHRGGAWGRLEVPHGRVCTVMRVYDWERAGLGTRSEERGSGAPGRLLGQRACHEVPCSLGGRLAVVVLCAGAAARWTSAARRRRQPRQQQQARTCCRPCPLIRCSRV